MFTIQIVYLFTLSLSEERHDLPLTVVFKRLLKHGTGFESQLPKALKTFDSNVILTVFSGIYGRKEPI